MKLKLLCVQVIKDMLGSEIDVSTTTTVTLNIYRQPDLFLSHIQASFPDLNIKGKCVTTQYCCHILSLCSIKKFLNLQQMPNMEGYDIIMDHMILQRSQI